MADRDFLDALDDCIDRLSQGQSAEDCARDYPQFRADLLPMLETQTVVRRAVPAAIEISQAKDRVRFRVQSHRRQRRPLVGLVRVAGGLMAAAIVALAAAGILAQDSLPGDALYGLKRVTENIQTGLSGDPPALSQQFEQRRLKEITRLLALRRAAKVEFEGELQAATSPDWRIADQVIRVTPDVPGAQSVKVGDLVRVDATTTTQGELVARSISLLKPGLPMVSPTPPSSSTPTVTSTPTSLPPSPAPTLTATAFPPPSTLPVAAGATATRAVQPTKPPAPTVNVSAPQPTDDHSGSGSNSGSSGSSGSNSGSSGSGSSGSSGSSGGSGDSGSDGGGSGKGSGHH